MEIITNAFHVDLPDCAAATTVKTMLPDSNLTPVIGVVECTVQ